MRTLNSNLYLCIQGSRRDRFNWDSRERADFLPTEKKNAGLWKIDGSGDELVTRFVSKKEMTLIPPDISVIFFSLTPHLTRVFSFTVTVSVRSVKPAGGGGGGWEMKSTCLPSLSCLSGSPCKTETDEAAGTCSPVHWGILRPIHTNARCLYPLSHVGLVSAKPVRAGCLSNRRRGWLHTRSVFRH